MTKHVHGGNVYQYKNCLDFSANCNPLGTPEGVKKAAADSLECICDYPRVGYRPLKEALARYEGVRPEEIICGNGAAELIFTLCHAQRPSRALVPAPTFAEYAQALESVGCETEEYMLSEENGFLLDEGILDRIEEGLDMVFLCNPNNPTGVLTDRRILEEILKKCRDTGVLLVVDECFLDFVQEPEEYTLKGYLDGFDGLFLLKAFTKRYAMAGIRLGYGLCGNRDLLERMDACVQPWNLSVIAQAAGIAALKEQDYVERGRAMVFSESARMKREMKSLGLKLYGSSANYIFFHGPERLFEDCAGNGILIRDCSNYTGLGKGYYRVAVKSPGENQRLLDVLGQILKKQGG